MFNDHPQPLNTNVTGLDAKELNYRFNGLSGLLDEGLDVWWYDRNWWVALVPPAPNLRKEVWGMRLYHDTTARELWRALWLWWKTSAIGLWPLRQW